MGDRIIHAIELMVRNNLKCIAVLKNQRPIGIVHLEDAFQKIGLMPAREVSHPLLIVQEQYKFPHCPPQAWERVGVRAHEC
jgi:signal-transduction protein with cAMP-binding, CBS, and nucleotidyltransferase domain